MGGVLNIFMSGVIFLFGSFLAFTQTFGLIYSMYIEENERVLKAAKINPTF